MPSAAPKVRPTAMLTGSDTCAVAGGGVDGVDGASAGGAECASASQSVGGLGGGLGNGDGRRASSVVDVSGCLG